MIRRVIVLEEAAREIEAAIDFYEAAEPGVGAYFRDSIIADLRRLEHYFGQHALHFGFHRAGSIEPCRTASLMPSTIGTTRQPARWLQSSTCGGIPPESDDLADRKT